MNIQTFQYAIEVEKAGSISKAATNLFVAQPNLSKNIKEMEEELGYEVFARMSTGVRVTDKGEMFLYHAKKMMDQLKEIEKIAGQKAETERRIRISIPRGSYIANGFTEFVANMDMGDKLEITISETNAIKTIENVAEKGYNMGIIRFPSAEESFFTNCLQNYRLVSETIWEFDYVLVMSADHPLASKKEIALQDLTPYVRISHGDIEIPGGHFGKLAANSTDVGGKIIYVYERGSQFDLLVNVPNTYMWVSPIPQSTLRRNHLVQRTCKVENNKYKDVLIYREDYELSDNDKLFQKKLYESKVDVSTQKII